MQILTYLNNIFHITTVDASNNFRSLLYDVLDWYICISICLNTSSQAASDRKVQIKASKFIN